MNCNIIMSIEWICIYKWLKIFLTLYMLYNNLNDLSCIAVSNSLNTFRMTLCLPCFKRKFRPSFDHSKPILLPWKAGHRSTIHSTSALHAHMTQPLRTDRSAWHGHYTPKGTRRSPSSHSASPRSESSPSFSDEG